MSVKALIVLLCSTSQDLRRATFLLEDSRLLSRYLSSSLPVCFWASLCLSACYAFFFMFLCASVKVKQRNRDFYFSAGDQHLTAKCYWLPRWIKLWLTRAKWFQVEPCLSRSHVHVKSVVYKEKQTFSFWQPLKQQKQHHIICLLSSWNNSAWIMWTNHWWFTTYTK